MKVIVIGGGPAGMLSAISAARSGCRVTLIEKNNMLGKKLLITGKGRCNITSSLDINDFIKNIPGNGRFLFSCFQNFTNEDIISLLEQQRVKVKEERGNRVFPVSDKSIDVRDALERELIKNNVNIKLNSTVKKILVEEIDLDEDENNNNNKEKSNTLIINKKVTCVELENGEIIYADKIILATGGKSYPRNRFNR